MLFCGFFSWLTTSLNILSYQSAKSSIVALISYSFVLYAFMADYFLFGQIIQGPELLGAITILSITLLTAVYRLYEESHGMEKSEKISTQ